MPQNQLHTLTHVCSHLLTAISNNSFSSIHKSQKTITTSEEAQVDQHGDWSLPSSGDYCLRSTTDSVIQFFRFFQFLFL